MFNNCIIKSWAAFPAFSRRVSALWYHNSVLSVRNLASPGRLYSSLLHSGLQLIDQTRPRGASCWNNKSRSSLRSVRDIWGRHHGAESRWYRCSRHLLPPHYRDRTLGRRHSPDRSHHLTSIILFYFSLWCGPTAGRWRDISWLGSSCSGCLLEPLCLQEILAANTSLVWRAQELRPASVSELSSSMWEFGVFSGKYWNISPPGSRPPPAPRLHISASLHR